MKKFLLPKCTVRANATLAYSCIMYADWYWYIRLVSSQVLQIYLDAR